ncbi:hypothetical protein [Kribbella deserti]|uniref:LPXTG cell wall anchor domain-containing protein n=1 Tax=Kribbella deserti TaxID=1926257 RepID=A0ABV6QJK4_9ACTN
MNEVTSSEQVGAPVKAKSSRAIALLSGAGALALGLGGLTLAMAPAASADGIVKPGNPTCAQLVPGSTEIKFDPPNAGSKTADGVTVKWTERELLVDTPEHPGDQTGGQLVDFTATGGVVLGAIIKGGPNANFYDYRPLGTAAGAGLHTPVNPNNKKFYGLSHVTFCVAKVVTTPTPTITTTVTPTPTITVTPTPTVTITPTPTITTTPPPTVTPSVTPTPTPTGTPTVTPSGTPSVTPSVPPTTPSATPTTSPSGTPTGSPSTPVPVPTEIDAGLSGGQQNTSASSNGPSTGGIALLCLGGVLVFAAVLKARQRRGQHSA